MKNFKSCSRSPSPEWNQKISDKKAGGNILYLLPFFSVFTYIMANLLQARKSKTMDQMPS